MRKRLSILLLIVGLVAVTGCIKELATTDNPNLNIIQTDKSITKEFKETENEKLITEEDISITSEDYSAVSSYKTLSTPGNLLVNRSNRLDKNYIPQSLRIPDVKFVYYATTKVKSMDASAAYALETLFKAAKEEGVTLLAVSGYRDYSYQKMLYSRKVSAAGREEADNYVAQPGTSEHQTGLAMDVLSDDYTSLDEGFDKTNAYKWLKNNCYKYGFIIRYPKDKKNITGYNYEPWHIRYVGISQATEISQKDITLEEYLNKVG